MSFNATTIEYFYRYLWSSLSGQKDATADAIKKSAANS